MINQDQTQLFKMEYGTQCDTFGCGEQGAFMIGRPDGPLNTSHVLCEVCTNSLVASIKEQYNDETTPAIEYELDEVLENIKTHAALDELIQEFDVKDVPNRDEEGGKLQERKDFVRAAIK